LTKDGDRLIASERLFTYDGSGNFLIFNYDGSSWRESFGSFVVVSNQRRDTEVVAASRDGEVLVVAEADSLPSSFMQAQYRGLIHIYRYNSDRCEYVLADRIHGEHDFLHLGSSLAITDNYTIVLGTASTGLRDRRTAPDHLIVYKHVMEQDNEENDTLAKHRWVRQAPLFGPTAEEAWWSLAVSSDGQRVVAGATLDRWEAETVGAATLEAGMDGLVVVFDLVSD
jgi:hypothetical protein